MDVYLVIDDDSGVESAHQTLDGAQASARTITLRRHPFLVEADIAFVWQAWPAPLRGGTHTPDNWISASSFLRIELLQVRA